MYTQRYRIILFIILCANYSLQAQTTADSVSCSATCGATFCCCTNDPTPTGIMISHVHSKNEWMLSYRYMNMSMGGMFAGNTPINEMDVYVHYLMLSDKMRMDMHMLMAMYGITDRFTLMAMFNYNYNTMNMPPSPFASSHNHSANTTGSITLHTMTSHGIGDTRLQILYALVHRQKSQLLLSAGVSIPTGSIQKKYASAMYPDKRLPYVMQLGSGTLDVLPAISYMYQWPKCTFSTQLTSVIRAGRNRVGYQLGNEFTFNTWLAYQWLKPLSSSIRFEAVTTDKITGYDSQLYAYTEPSANPYNYGGKRMNVYAGAVFQPAKGLFSKHRLGVECGYPLYQHMNGIQMRAGKTVNASWAYVF